MLVPRWSGTRDLDRKIAVETRRIRKRNWKLIKASDSFLPRVHRNSIKTAFLGRRNERSRLNDVVK